MPKLTPAERSKRYREKHPERHRASVRNAHRKLRYGIDHGEFVLMLVVQNHRCAVCSRAFDNPKHRHIDHNHETGQVRGVLCTNCNLGIGHFHDRPDLLEAAIVYLKRPR